MSAAVLGYVTAAGVKLRRWLTAVKFMSYRNGSKLVDIQAADASAYPEPPCATTWKPWLLRSETMSAATDVAKEDRSNRTSHDQRKEKEEVAIGGRVGCGILVR